MAIHSAPVRLLLFCLPDDDLDGSIDVKLFGLGHFRVVTLSIDKKARVERRIHELCHVIKKTMNLVLTVPVSSPVSACLEVLTAHL